MGNLMDQGFFSPWQETLRGILGSYLDGDYLRVRSRWSFPLHWQLSTFAVRTALTDLAYASRIWVPYSGEPAVAAYLNHLDQVWAQLSINPENSLLHVLTEGYRLLDHLAQTPAQGSRLEKLPAGPSFDTAAYLADDPTYFAPVVRLASFVRRQMKAYLSLALIHGSVADLTCCKGYSDLDTLLVLTRETALDPERLRQFARIYYRSLTELYRFDPLQHHGHMVMTAIDLDAYSENWLPLSTFAQARYLCQPAGEVSVRVQDSRQPARHAFDIDVDYFRLFRMRHWKPASAYDFKYYLSILMLLPTRYLQAKGLMCDKSASFALARQLLPGATWDSLDYATRLRSGWPSMRPGLVDSLGRAVGSVNVQTLRYVQRALLRRSFDLSLRQFSDPCVAQSEALAGQMFNDVYADSPRRMSLAAAPSLESEGSGQALAITRHPIGRTQDEYQQTREHYVNRVKEIGGVTAIYEFGTITAPGLSDLDFVVCVADTAEARAAEALSIASMPFGDQDLILHDPIVVPDTQIEAAPEFLAGSSLRVLWRNGSRPMPPGWGDAEREVFAKAAKLIEKLFSFQVWLAEVHLSQTLDARWTIALLRALVYASSLTESITGNTPAESAAYALAVDDLRARWFEESSLYRKNMALRSLFERGQHLACQLIEMLDEFFLRSGWLNVRAIAAPDRVVCAVPHTSIRVAFSSTPDPACGPAQKTAGEAQPLISLPVTFLRALALYGQSAPYLAERLTVGVLPRAGEPEGAPLTAFERYLCERGQRLEAQTRFLVQHQMPYGSYMPKQLLDLSKGNLDAARQRDYSGI